MMNIAIRGLVTGIAALILATSACKNARIKETEARRALGLTGEDSKEKGGDQEPEESPTPTPTPTSTKSSTPTPDPTPSSTSTPTPDPTPSSSPTVFPSPTVTPCVEDNNEEAKTFSNNPSWHAAVINARIKEKKLNYPLLNETVPILRSTGATGKASKWKTDGNAVMGNLNMICRLLGYREYVSSTCKDFTSDKYPDGQCNFHTPEDNKIQSYDESTHSWILQPAAEKYEKTWVATITCKGRLICE